MNARVAKYKASVVRDSILKELEKRNYSQPLHDTIKDSIWKELKKDNYRILEKIYQASVDCKLEVFISLLVDYYEDQFQEKDDFFETKRKFDWL